MIKNERQTNVEQINFISVLKITHYAQVQFVLGIKGCFDIRNYINVIFLHEQIKGKNVPIISVDTKERFNQIHHLLSFKTKSVDSYDKVSLCRIQVCDWG